jgi:MFS transporter, DHA2 family, multidrug resistance protein
MSLLTEQPYARRWQALGVLALSLLVICIDNTILNVALPSISTELGVDSSESQWIVDSYLLVFACLLLVGGNLGDRFGRRKFLFIGLTTFGIGSLLAAMSGSAHELIASRCLMGVGAAAIMPATLSILTNIFPPNERPKAIAAWAATSGLGVALGPITGGLLLEQYSWNSVFVVNLPIVIVALIAGAILIPESRDPESPRIDILGAILSTAGLTAVVWGLIEASDRGWADSTILGAFGVGVLILTGFFAWERRTAQPMLDVSIFRNLRFSAASVSITLVFFALMGTVFLLTTYLQTVLGYSALGAGVRMLPVALGLIVGSRASVKLVARAGDKAIVVAGLVVVAAALWLFSTINVDSGYTVAGTALAIMGFGMGLAMAPATEAIMGALPKAKAGVGSAMNDVLREVGGTLGVAVLGSLLASRYGPDMNDAAAQLPAGASNAATDSVDGAHVVATQLGGDAATSLVSAADQAFVNAMSTTTALAAVVALAGATVALIFLPSRGRPATESAEEIVEIDPVTEDQREPARV